MRLIVQPVKGWELAEKYEGEGDIDWRIRTGRTTNNNMHILP